MKRFFKSLYLFLVTALAAYVLLVAVGGSGMENRLKAGFVSLADRISGIGEELSQKTQAAEAAADSRESSSALPQPVKQAEWGSTGMDGVSVYQYGRSLLSSDTEKSVYDQIAKAVLEAEPQLTLDCALQPEAMEKIYKYYYADHTENFYLSKAQVSYKYVMIGTDKKYKSYTYTFAYKYDLNTINSMRSRLGSAVRKLLSSAGGKTQLQKERALHDGLVRAVSYDMDTASETGNDDSPGYTAYGALVNGTAVCDGYAKAMKLLLDSAQIRSLYLCGTASSGSRAAPMPGTWCR